MNKRMQKTGLTITLLLLIAVGVTMGVRYFIFSKIRSIILSQVEDLQKQGYSIHYQSFITNSWKNEIAMVNLEVGFPSGSADSTMRIVIRSIGIKGMEFIPFILKNELRVEEVLLGSPAFRYNKNVEVQRLNIPIKKRNNGFFIEHFHLDTARFEVWDSISSKASSLLQFNLDATGLSISDPAKSMMFWIVDRVMLDSVHLKLPTQFYTLTLQKLSYDGRAKIIQMDSFRILPDYDKTEFARKSRHQTDRIECVVPFMEVRGVEMDTTGNALHASHAELNFYLTAFRDRRYNILNAEVKALPLQILQDMHVKVKVDTAQISDSAIVYEELPEAGGQPGNVVFHDLQATIYNISNISDRDITMNLNAKFMEDGDLHADFIFPVDLEKPSSVKGTLRNLDMIQVNRMLIPAASIKVESGMLKALNFQFKYNNYRSDGLLTMQYADLKLISLSKKSNGKVANKLTTFLIKVFVVKREMDKDKSQGKILFYRDPYRSVFNFWWKSVLSGIKSVYNLDNFMDTAHTKRQ